MKQFYLQIGICLATILWLSSTIAETRVDLSNSQGTGTGTDTILIRNIQIDTESIDPLNPMNRQMARTFYNVTFRLNPHTLHLEPIFIEGACATLRIHIVNAENQLPLPFTKVTIGTVTQEANAEGVTEFIHLLPVRTVMTLNQENFEPGRQETDLNCTYLNEITVGLKPKIVQPPVEVQPQPNIEIPKQIRISLDWAEDPRDLDVHLTGPEPGAPETYNNEVNRFHVYFGNRKTADNVAVLQVDEFAATKPEILFINPPPGQDKLRTGSYRLSVQHFAGRGTLLSAQAKIRLWIGNQAEQLFTPLLIENADLNGAVGDVWIVCDILVNEEGRVTVIPVQRYSKGINSGNVRSR